ncbi:MULTISPECIES: phage capsid family protein [unclassified Bartonella]|uniref:phage capsid family protein n=1 Tax=unclassified Bartonella TaxID=2645622 RepID=UPI00300DEF34
MKKNYMKRNGHKGLEAYSQFFDKEVAKKNFIAPLIGKDANSIIQLKEVTNKEKCNKAIFNLRGYLHGNEGALHIDDFESGEGRLHFVSDCVAFKDIFYVLRAADKDLFGEYSMHELRKEAKYSLVDWYTDCLSAMFFLHVSGYTAFSIENYAPNENADKTFDNILYYYSSHQPTRPTDKRIIRANGKATDEELDENDIFSLELLDKAILRAKRETPRMRPVCVDGENFYVLYLHPIQLDQLRANTEKEQWREITKALHYKKSETNSPLLNGAVGIYNGVILHETERVTPGVQYNEVNEGEGHKYSRDKCVPNVRRAVLLGARSVIMAIKKDRGARYKFAEKRFSYSNELGVIFTTTIGMKKTRFNIWSPTRQLSSSLFCDVAQQDFGVIVLPTYAA